MIQPELIIVSNSKFQQLTEANYFVDSIQNIKTHFDNLFSIIFFFIKKSTANGYN